jgi:demethylmenaquinone methyltransferase/2-methoxy-6-polyprenyl-1,4-benzoquinol methylase
MLQVASNRLKSTAQLALGDATSMPYEDARFDLVIAMLALHEMSPKIRPQVLCEIKRVLKKDGRILLIDFHNGPYQPVQGWVSKGIIIIAELAAGRNHFINYRNFMNEGGLDRLINQQSLQIEKQQVLGGGTFGIYLVR